MTVMALAELFNN